VRPQRPINQNPDTTVPTTAPAVLRAYSIPTRPPSRPLSIDDDTTSGRLAPISVAGIINTTKESANRTRVRTPSWSVTFLANDT
jgi:hypothetical protein